jgi:hypothetical protein
MSRKVFISYRRGEDSGYAGRLFDTLLDAFDPDRVFMDVDNIEPGMDFFAVLEEKVAQSDVMLAVIGKHWADAIDAKGNRRLENPKDFVRIEIEAALNQNKRVIPVLVGDSEMPSAEELPESLQPLARRHALRVTHERYRSDVEGLIKALKRILDRREPEVEKTDRWLSQLAKEMEPDPAAGPTESPPAALSPVAAAAEEPTVEPPAEAQPANRQQISEPRAAVPPANKPPEITHPSAGVHPASEPSAPLTPAPSWKPARFHRHTALLGFTGIAAAILAIAVFWLVPIPHKPLDKPAMEAALKEKAPEPLPKTPDRGSQAAAAAQRVVLYDEDPSDPKGQRYVGSVIWRTEQIKAVAGQKADLAVRADIDIPERKFKMTMSFRRNTDVALPASHTFEFTFILPSDFAGGGVASVPGLLMKSDEQARGTALTGRAVKISAGVSLEVLPDVDADRQRNVQLLKERTWFDMPLVYVNQRRALIAIEKGAAGERAFNEAFAAWGE